MKSVCHGLQEGENKERLVKMYKLPALRIRSDDLI